MIAKLLLQKLWKLGLDWDEVPPDGLADIWKDWLRDIPSLARYPVKRRVVPHDDEVVFQQVHAFADASTEAYGAVVYLRTVYRDTSVSTVLITSKARVAPVKPLTVPRLELLAAYLLTRLVQSVITDLRLSMQDVYAWTDSSIVLAWLRKSSANLKVFVANRVRATQEVIPGKSWRHVRSAESPADLASRGMSPPELLLSTLWWEGPPWLKSSPSEWPPPLTSPTPIEVPELKHVAYVTSPEVTWELWKKYSSFDRLIRIVAWLRRFTHNTRQIKERLELAKTLTAEELAESRLKLLILSQQESYPELFFEGHADQSKTIPSCLARFNVSVDQNGLIKVSGRVRNPNATREACSVIPLSLKSNLCKLLITTSHYTLSHPGVSILLSVLAEAYYIPGVRNHIKLLSPSCTFCRRVNAKAANQKMGLSSQSRVRRQLHPFAPLVLTSPDRSSCAEGSPLQRQEVQKNGEQAGPACRGLAHLLP